ncbi:SusC/RagA family TonB-linked outer membrane protein [Mucilaginibacter sp. RS28]|uniref:SusC/RagA family TonB-linked outer membrane protein n=1 Tax=Mucilaginibacter straminoryzae TaxID=2932774 RepID=A0A9X1X7S6_9SPHI|nr:SusC/RagA family TonB-linked outer membrane protein [Mucilaginibacter straminoryzae]MCJ8211258.1 SusC/RagA family TonB-linked outer membrane protein [Mucilaginibacter straminoryzae]
MKKHLRKHLLWVLMLLVGQLAYSQTRTVTGTVTAQDDGLPIPGVSVSAKGTRVGTQTGGDGRFSLKVPSGVNSLVFSFIGYTTVEVPINGSIVNAKLVTNNKQLNEVVVTGAGVATSKARLGISVESVSAKDLPAAPTASIDQALVGKIPGAQISSVNGNPGQPVNIVLRGINTIQGGTSPMILIDGVQLAATDLNSIDLNNIERVEVVQGAASATIYGAQGANGVIQLFTKKGKVGETRIDLSTSQSVNELINHGDVHKAQYHSLVTDASGNILSASTGKPLTFDPTTGSFLDNVTWNSLDPTNQNNKPYNSLLPYQDHYKQFFGKSHTNNSALSIYGGSEKVEYNFSAANNYSNTVFKNNGDFNRSNVSSNITFNLFKGLKFRTNTQLVYTRNFLLDQTGRGILYSLNNTRPFANYGYRDALGNYGSYFGDATGVNGYNPNYQFQYEHQKNYKTDIIQNFQLNYTFPKFLELDAKYGINYRRENNNYVINPQDDNANSDYWQTWATNQYGAAQIDQTGENDHDEFTHLFQNFIATATLRTDFQNDFHLKIPIRTTTQFSYDYRNDYQHDFYTYGADAPSYTPFNFTNYLVFKTINDYTTKFITFGYLLNQKIEYGEYGGVEGGFRSDYSSAFGQGSKPFRFPRLNAYLRPSSFEFWKDGGLGKIFPEVKLRGAYGEAGIQPFAYDRYVVLGTKNIGSTSAFYFPNNPGNPLLNVEVSKETEFGTDIAIAGLKNTNWFNNFQVSFTYWKRQTDNTIYNVDLAPSTGLGSTKQNAFGLKSNGVQASLNFSGYKSKKFTWDFTANFGRSNSIISKIIGAPVVVTSNAGSTNYVLQAGDKIGQLYGYLMLHAVDEKAPNGSYYIPQAQQANYTVASNGWVVSKTTKQPYVTPTQYAFGDPNPKFNMSFINNFGFNNLINVSFQVDWVYGSHIYNQTKEWMYRDGISGDYDKPITIDGQTGAWTAFYRGVYAQVSRNGTKNYFYEDASFARLRNLSFAVNLNKLLNRPSVKKLQLVFTGRNLVTISKYSGYDPEVSSGSSNSTFDRGVDHNTIPNLKTYQLGLNVGL